MKSKIRFIAAFSALVAVSILVVSAALPNAARATETSGCGVYDTVLRLHVIANSDSEFDQGLKLEVRDAVLDAAQTLFAGCGDRDEAAERAALNADKLKNAADSVLASAGVDYRAEVFIGKETYPTRVYESAAYPEGEYLSLRIVLGEGEGQNWWCVLFPPLCLSAAKQKTSETAVSTEVGLTAEQFEIITRPPVTRYRVKLKFFELLTSMKNK